MASLTTDTGGSSVPTPRPAKMTVSTGDTIFNEAYERISSTADCSSFLKEDKTFRNAIVTLALHPCWRKAGEESKVLTIGCRSQGGDGVKIEPKTTYKTIETQCPGAGEKRPDTTELMVMVDINEVGLGNNDLLSLLWDLGKSEGSSLGGTAYTRQLIGQNSYDLPWYVLQIRPVSRSGQPANGYYEFPKVQLINEGNTISLAKSSENKATLTFNVLYDETIGGMGWVYSLA